MLLSVSSVLYAQDELCTDGILLFHEDFGGNDPSDPAVGRTAVPGMSSGYQQIYKLQTSDPGTGFGAGCYLVAKRGYRNSTNSNYSVWHIMDDHTYFGDTTRGYFLEIDGKGSGNDVFYSTVIDGLCEGSRLTFSAYVANLTTAGQYNAWRSRNYVHPKLSFVLTNPQTGAELARYNTDTISHDWSNYPKSWRETADWQLIGMNFTVPEGIDSVRLSIRNNASGSSTGNDFALDDIEIHLCMPPIHVNGVQEACPGEAVTLGSELDYPYMVYEALYYKWWYSPDSLNWTEIDYGIDHFQLNIPDAGSSDSGWYKVAMGTEGRMDNDNCHTTSEPFRLTVKDCGTPEPPVTVTIVSPDSVCPNDPYTFEVNIENGEQLEEPVEYQWWYRSPEYPTVWNKVSGGNLRDLQISSFKTQHVGWYKVMVAGNGGIRDEDMRVESEEYFVTFKKCEPDLCLDGTLLYRDDFGGNDPNDPRVGTDPVSGMAYSQSTNDRFGQMGNGRYIVTKTGYCNGDTAALRSQRGYVPDWGSQWILQDDHTYPNDRTRGYYVEIDGSGGNTPFYSTTIDGLCPGSKLTFSAYVVNVHFYEQVQKFYRVGRYNYVYPRMKFVLKDPQNGQTLATQSTGDIQPDVTKSWNIFLNESAEWQLVGMEFTVPEGVESIQMYIYNDVVGYGTGNDFAMDDIEIHLCAPSVTIEGEPEFCVNETATLSADFTNDGTFEEPLVYKWWHSTDSVTWIEMTDFIGENPVINAVQKADSGWYKVAVAGNGNIENVNCRAVSEPFRLTVKECTPSAPDLCMDGILLFREDFGGNDPNDPKISTTPVSGMSYTQVTTDALGSMGSGKYLVTKQGYCNGNGTSQWHLQDDHTYFGDITRGYLLEIDGRAGSDAFYQTTIDHLCEGIELTFSAYVANVMTWGMYIGRPGVYAYPRLKFVLTNPQDNSELATYDTGDIPFDSAFIGDNMCWQQSVQWRLVGMNFTVPVGVESIQLSIYNNVSNSNGNDFAIDDIEIHLCMTPDTIRTDTIVCDTISQILWRDSLYQIADTLRDTLLSSCGFDSIYYLLHIETEHCEPPTPPVMEPLCTSGILLFREDFGGNNPEDPQVSTTPVPGIYERYTQVTRTESCMSLSCCNCDDMKEGSYTITKQGYRNSYTADYSIWYIMDDHTYPNDTTRGYFLEVDGKGGNVPLYTTTLNGLCAGLNLSFSSYIANIVTPEQYLSFRTTFKYSYPKLRFVIADPQNGNILAQYTTDTIGHDWSYYNTSDSWKQSANWQLEGMSFVVPEGISQIELSIYNAVNNVRIGNDFAIDDIEIRLCMIPDTVKMDTTVCDTISQILWHEKTFAVADTLCDTLFSSCGFDSIYYIMKVDTKICCPDLHYATHDTIVCDTLMPYTWHGLLFDAPGSQTTVEKDERGCDTLQTTWTLNTKICCPDLLTITLDTTVCDTLLPFTWRGMVFEVPTEMRIMEQSPRGCDSIEHVYRLDTFHCERLYPIIVNKYNWQLLCHNVRVRELFPELTVTGYQWYKDGTAIPNATEDDYSEQNELQGEFQLRLHMSDGRYVWSEILTIQPGQTQAPSRIRIYNHNGYLFYQSEKETTIPSLPRGLYIIQIEQNGEQRIEKKLIP